MQSTTLNAIPVLRSLHNPLLLQFHHFAFNSGPILNLNSFVNYRAQLAYVREQSQSLQCFDFELTRSGSLHDVRMLFLLTELVLKYGKCDVEQSHRTRHYESQAEEEHDGSTGLLEVVHNGRPALHSDDLKHVHQRPTEPMERLKRKVRREIGKCTFHICPSIVGCASHIISAQLVGDDPRHRIYTVLVELVVEQLHAKHRECYYDKQQQHYRIEYQRHGCKQSLHNHFERVKFGDGPQRPQHSDGFERCNVEADVGCHQWDYTRDDHYEVQQIPAVSKVCVTPHHKPTAEHLDQHLQNVETQKELLQRVLQQGRLAGQRICQYHYYRIGQNHHQRKRLEQLILDQQLAAERYFPIQSVQLHEKQADMLEQILPHGAFGQPLQLVHWAHLLHFQHCLQLAIEPLYLTLQRSGVLLFVEALILTTFQLLIFWLSALIKQPDVFEYHFVAGPVPQFLLEYAGVCLRTGLLLRTHPFQEVVAGKLWHHHAGVGRPSSSGDGSQPPEHCSPPGREFGVSVPHNSILLMGNLELRDSSGLKLMTLSFSSLMASPFEFYSENNSEEAKAIDKHFKVVLKQELQLTDIEVNNYKWELGEIDKRLQRNRYSVLYDRNCCSRPREDGIGYELVGREQFKQIWDKRMQTLIVRENEKSQYIPQPNELLNCLVFDFICYMTLLRHVLGSDTSIDNIKDLGQDKVQQFQRYLTKAHETFIVEPAAKMKLILDFALKYSIDLVFIQQIEEDIAMDGQFDWSSFERVFRNRNIILYRKQTFRQAARDRDWQQNNSGYFDWYPELAYCKLGNLLVSSVHLTSKYPQNEKLADEILKKLMTIKQSNPKLEIAVGINSNHCIEESNLSVFPGLENPTSSKKRTYLQAQFNKACIQIHEVKDHLISTERLYDCRVMKIDNSPLTQNSFMPCIEHPFGNLIVFGRVSSPF